MRAANPARSLPMFLVERARAIVYVAALSICFPISGVAEETKPSDDTTFTAQCPKLLAIANDFAHECRKNARALTSDWYPAGHTTPVKEYHAAYFRAVDSGSHFGLGCTLTSDPNFDFIGIYYAAQSSTFAVANTAPLRLLDFNGNVGLTVDGKQVTLLPIRQFETDSIGLRFRILAPKDDPEVIATWKAGLGPIKNCENITFPDGRNRGGEGSATFYAFEKQDHGDHEIKSCIENPDKPDPGCRSANYIEFFPSKHKQIIYQGDAAFWYIRDGGDLLVKEDVLSGSCGPTKLSNNFNIAHEVCDIPHQPDK
jgi:hypothetical protein